MDRQGESPDMVQKMLGVCVAKTGTKADKLLLAGTDGHQRIWQNGEKNPNTRGRESPSQRGKELDIRRKKKRITRKEYRRLLNNFEMEGLMEQKSPVELGQGENHEGKMGIAI